MTMKWLPTGLTHFPVADIGGGCFVLALEGSKAKTPAEMRHEGDYGQAQEALSTRTHLLKESRLANGLLRYVRSTSKTALVPMRLCAVGQR